VVDRRLSILIAALAALLVLAVLWDAFAPPARRRRPAAVSVVVDAVRPAPPPPGPPPLVPPPPADSAHAQPLPPRGNQPGYFDQLARAESRRRIRASAGYTYLSEVLAESQDSALHRWDDRAARPVRVYLPAGTVANFQPAFLDAVRNALERWAEAGVPVRFVVEADSTQAEVRVRWKVQFDIDRTGQTDLTWDQEGHILSCVVTLATFDPRGRPLTPDDIQVVAIHEIGHVLGLDHSSDSSDIMFASTRVRDLSPRDIRTAVMLYQLAPGSLR
jgi:predicted Zn-dependent protease